MRDLIVLTIVLFIVQCPWKIFGQTEAKPKLVVQTGHFSYIKGGDISRDGRYVANISNDSIKLWELTSGREIWTSNEISKPLEVVFSPNSRLLAVANLHVVGIWSLTDGKFLGGFDLGRIDYINQGYTTILFSSNSLRLLVANSNWITEWNLLDGQKMRELKTIEHSQAGTFSSDGKYFVSLFENKPNSVETNKESNSKSIKMVRIYDLLSLTETCSFSVDYNRWDPLFQLKIADVNTKTRIVAVATTQKSVDFFDLDTGNFLNSIKLSYETSSISINSEGTQIAIVDSVTENGKTFSRATVTNINTGSLLLDEKEERSIFCLRFSRAGNLLFIAGESKTSKIWNVANQRLVSQFTPRASRITASTLSHDSRLFATGSWNGRINIWDILTGRVIKSFFSDDSGINSLEFNLKGDKIISGGVDKTVRFWSLESTNSEIFKQNEIVETVSFNKEKKLLAICNQNEAILWDFPKQETLQKLQDLDKNGFRNRIESCKFSPDGNILAVKFFASKTILYDTQTWLQIKTLPEILGKYIEFSPDGKFVSGITVHEGDTSSKYFLDLINIKDWNKISINLNAKSYYDLNLTPFTFSPDNEHIVTTLPNGTIKLWNIKTGTEIWSIAAHSNAILSLNFTKDGKYLFSGSIDMKTSVWNIKNGQKICDLIVLNEKDWIVATPDGKFDTNSLENPQGLQWIMPDAPLAPLSFEIFMRDYYEPNLLPRLLKCTEENNCAEEFKTVRDLSSLNRTQPKIQITKIVPASSPNTVEVSAEVENVASEYQKDSLRKSLSSGVYDVRLFRDGQIVGHSTSDEKLQRTFRTYENFEEELPIWREANKVELVNGKKTFTFQVNLPNNPTNQPVEFSAYAFNGDRVKSETARFTYKPEKPNPQINPRKAYVIALGVNKSQSSVWNLKFAVNDARSTIDVLSKKLRDRGEFSEVTEIPLISDEKYQDATKENVKTVFDLLSGKKNIAAERLKKLGTIAGNISQAQPDDAIFILFSSHGYGDTNGSFYIFPSDIGATAGRTVTTKLTQNLISSDELSLWLRDVDAGNMVMIVDACNAEWAVRNNGFKPAPMGSRGLGQLAFDKGMMILAGTQTENAANEIKQVTENGKNKSIEHGLLSYSLINEGLLEGKADFKIEDKKIILKEWLEFAEFRVPTLYEIWQEGKAPKGPLKDAPVNPRKFVTTQRPYLFDFTRKKQYFTLATIP